MAEHDSPNTSLKAAGDLLRANLPKDRPDTKAINTKYAALDAYKKKTLQELHDNRIARSKTLDDFSRDAAVSLSQGVVNTGNVAVSILDALTRPSEIQRNVEASMGIPTQRSLSEILNIDENTKRTNKIIEEEFMSERGKDRVNQFETNTAERAAGKKARVKKLVEEDGYNENVATLVDEAGTFADTVMEFVDNPTLLLDETIKSIPLMLSGGVGAQLSKKVASGLTTGSGTVLKTSAIKEATSGVGGAATAIGVTEGASSAGSTKADVLKMTEEQLFTGSEEYVELRETRSHEDARRLLANKAAERAFAIAAPIAAIAGKVTGAAKFEADLFSKGQKVTSAVKKTVKNTASEAAEEGIQGLSGKLSENIAKQTITDKDQELTKGVGKSTGAGVAVGAAAGAGLSAPKNAVGAVTGKISDSVVKTKSDKAVVAKAVDKGIDAIKSDPDNNINLTLESIAQRNAVEGVTQEEHEANLATAYTALTDNLSTIASLDEEITGLEGKAKKTAQKKVTKLKDQQSKAFEQYKQIQAKEKASVTTDEVQASIESSNVEDFMGSFRISPESVNQEDVDAFRANTKGVPKEALREIEAHLAVEESIKSLDEVSDNILNGSSKDKFLGIRNYQSGINAAMSSGDYDSANTQLAGLRKFAENHAKKADVFKRAFAGDAQAALEAIEVYDAKKGIIAESRNAKFSKGLVETVQKESIALDAAVKQAEARIGINQPKQKPLEPKRDTIPGSDNVKVIKTTEDNNVDVITPTTTQAEVTKAEPIVTDASSKELVTTSSKLPIRNLTKLHNRLKSLPVKEDAEINEDEYDFKRVDNLRKKAVSLTGHMGIKEGEDFDILNDKDSDIYELMSAVRNIVENNEPTKAQDSLFEGTPDEQLDAQAVVPKEVSREPVDSPNSDVTDASTQKETSTTPFKLEEVALGTLEERTSLSDKGFKVKAEPKGEKASPAALTVEPDLLNRLAQDPNIALKYANKSKLETDSTGESVLSDNQKKAIKSMTVFDSNLNKSFTKLFRVNPKNAESDYLQFMVQEDGSLDPNVRSAITMSTYEWLKSSGGNTVFNNYEDINSILGRKADAPVSSGLADILTEAGATENSITDSIGASAVKALGLQVSETSPENTKSNLEQSLGAMGLTLLLDSGYVSTKSIETKDINSLLPIHEQTKEFTDYQKKNFYRVNVLEVDGKMQMDASVAEVMDSNSDTAGLFTELFGIQFGTTGPTTTPNKNVAKKMRKTNMNTPAEVVPIIKAHQERAHYISREKMDRFVALDEEVQLEIMGYNTDLDSVHISKRKGVTAKNNSIIRELGYMLDANEEFGDKPMYFTHEMTVVNRLLLVSNTFNPQGSKTHRHFVNQPSWNSEIDRDNSQHMQEFFTAFGESMDIKTDAGVWADYGPEIMSMVNDPAVIQAATAVLSGGDPKLFLPFIKEGAYSYDGLMNLGRYQEAISTGSKTFTSDLFREVDGVTNGVIIGTLNLNAGNNHSDITTKLARGGLMSDGITDKFGPYRGSNDDSYTAISNVWKNSIESKIRSLRGNEQVRILKAREIFGSIERNDSKGGLIQTVYGAADPSIKSGVAYAFLERFYDQVTDAVKAKDTTKLRALSQNMNAIIPGSIKLQENPLEQELSNKHENALIKYIEGTYGEALVNTIEESFGDFKEKGGKINTALDIAFQSYTLMRTAEIAKKEVDGYLITPKDLNDIDTGLLRAMPIMHTYFSQKTGDIQEGLFVGKYEMQRNEAAEFKMDQRYKTNPTGGSKKSVSTQGRSKVMVSPGASPAVLGVQSIDAATMLKHLGNHGALNVYDAIIVGQMDAMQQARYINKMFLDVQSEYSIMGAAYESMTRSLDLLQTYDPALINKIELKGDTSIEEFITNLQSTVTKVDQAKAERMESFTLSSQYHVDGGETNLSVNLPSNVPKSVVKEVLKQGIDFKGSSSEGIDLDQFQSDVVTQVTRMNVTQVFDSLGSVGSVKDSVSHTNHLKSLMENVVDKVLDPVTLHQENNNQGETRGMTNGVDMYIINQVAQPKITVSGMTTNGTRMSSQEVYSHEMVHNVSRVGVDKASPMSRRIEKLWNAAKAGVPMEAFMNPSVADTAIERKAAQAKWDHIFSPTTKGDGKSADYLHEFMAFAMTNARFREALDKINPNVGADFKEAKTFLEYVAAVFAVIMDTWHKLTVVKGNLDVTAKEQMDNLFTSVSGVNIRHKNVIISELEAKGEILNSKMNGLIIASRKQVAKAAKSKIFLESKLGIVRVTGRVTGLIAEDRAGALVDTIKRIHADNTTGKEGLIAATVTEMQGRTLDNGQFQDLNRIANMTIDQQRNQIKTLVSEMSESMYTAHKEEGLTDDQKTAITKVALKTDLGSLVDGRTLEDIQELVESDTKLDAEIKRISDDLYKFTSKTMGNFYTRMAHNLGHFMVIGKGREAHTLMNAKQIAEVWVEGRPTPVWAGRAEPLIDQLATLYAIKYSDQQHRKEFSEVMLTEMAQNNVKNGISYTLSMTENLKKDANDRLFVGHNAMIKGYQKETMNPHIGVEYGTKLDEAEMNRMGFFMAKDAKALPKDKHDPSRGTDVFMYVNRHGGLNRFASGTISGTGKVAKGANTFTVRSQTGISEPGIVGHQDVKDMKAAKQSEIDEIFTHSVQRRTNQEFAIPVMNHTGKITGYRYMMSEHTKDTYMEKNNAFNEVLGTTAASIQDKVSSKASNENVIDALKAQFDTDFATKASSFIEIGPNSSDKSLREMYYMLPDESRRYAKTKWGGDTMWVKRDQINLIFGYRKFSITDVWHDDPADLNGFQRVYIQSMDQLFSKFGGSAYSGLKSIESTWQEIIKDIKDIIVIKTGVVTAMNTLSNTISLRMLGVPMGDILRDQAEAFRGAVEYQKDSKEIHTLESILANDQRPNRRTLDQQRIAELKNRIKNNPVRELVESGVYQTIVEDIDNSEGNFTYKSKFTESVGDLTEPYTSKIPQGVKTVAKNLYMAHDSTTYKIFNQAAVLSDFTARYALHKHYTTRAVDKLSSKDAIAKVVSIFIDYDLPTHVGVQYANDMGVMWFSKYNFRLQKILMETMSENPARVMMLLMLQSSFGELPSMYDNSVLTHDMTSMFRNPLDNLTTVSQIAPINMGTSLF